MAPVFEAVLDGVRLVALGTVVFIIAVVRLLSFILVSVV
jgi:hypothetical protein